VNSKSCRPLATSNSERSTSYFPVQKSVSAWASAARAYRFLATERRCSGKWRAWGVGSGADGEEIVGDDSEADPAIQAFATTVSTAIEAVPALEGADPPFGTCAPPQGSTEPGLSLAGALLGQYRAGPGQCHAMDAAIDRCGPPDLRVNEESRLP
jgi:hypothetical protein